MPSRENDPSRASLQRLFMLYAAGGAEITHNGRLTAGIGDFRSLSSQFCPVGKNICPGEDIFGPIFI